MAVASLEYDGIYFSNPDILSLGTQQIHNDALRATLKRFIKKPNHNYIFLEQLCLEMEIRGLTVRDMILLPKDKKNFSAIVEIIEKDLNNIQINTKK